jgi:hypothetical protein
VGTSDKADPNLRRTLDQLEENDTVEVLVYPAGGTEGLLAYLTSGRDAGDLQFNVLDLAGCIALRARRTTIDELIARDDVARVTINPTFTANDAS